MTAPVVRRLLLTLAGIGLLFGGSLYLADIDTDITRYLPQGDPVLVDAGYIFRHHPIQDQVVIDISLSPSDPDLLVRFGERVESRLKESGLFRQAGMGEIQAQIPELLMGIPERLPVLFSARQLETEILPRLSPERIRQRMAENRDALAGLDGIGRARLLAADPLGFHEPVMTRLSHLAPSLDVRFQKGQLLSADRQHLLVTAAPARPGSDTAFARRLSAFMTGLSESLRQDAAAAGRALFFTPVGAYRAALDNEEIARRDVTRAILFATAGIALLLLFAFPRPWMGLLAFLPALAGTAAAFFVCVLVFDRLSIMALGFGGAIISITVDHGIAYLLFMDRSRSTAGRDASREIRAVGLLTALTTMGAFGTICFSGFPLFRQLGLFSALGIGFSFLFVHTIFPRILPGLPPAPLRALPLRRLAARLTASGRPGFWIALCFGGGMLLFARPMFNVSLSAMNTVSAETAAAEALVTRVWGGGVFSKVFLMTEAPSLAGLQEKWDRLLASVRADRARGVLSGGFVPAMIFPGNQLQHANLAAWRAFWTPARIAALERHLGEAAAAAGFAPDAFTGFYQRLSGKAVAPGEAGIPPDFFTLLGIRRTGAGESVVQFSSLTPGPEYDPEGFYAAYRRFGPIFDGTLFSQRLGRLLFSVFTRMLVVIGGSVAVLLLLFFMELRLTAAALAPVLFALVATLGTLHLAGHALDIPALMLSIIVFGMGIDYSLYLVRAWQRYGGADQAEFALIRVAVLMAAVSTLIGFGTLWASDHSLLRSAGLTAFLGIGYCLLGAFLILPPLLERLFRHPAIDTDCPLIERVRMRYRCREAYPRLFARFKLRQDVMFAELPRFLDHRPPPAIVLDVGGGYGVPGAWILERFPEARLHGIDPDPERVRIAALAWGSRGRATPGAAPDLSGLPGCADLVLLLDIIHFLSEEAFRSTLTQAARHLLPGGRMILRAVIAPRPGRASPMWHIESWKLRLAGAQPYYREPEAIAKALAEAGFHVAFRGESGGNPESMWFVADRTAVLP